MLMCESDLSFLKLSYCTGNLQYNVPSKSQTLDCVIVELTLYWNNNTYRIYTITQSPPWVKMLDLNRCLLAYLQKYFYFTKCCYKLRWLLIGFVWTIRVRIVITNIVVCWSLLLVIYIWSLCVGCINLLCKLLSLLLILTNYFVCFATVFYTILLFFIMKTIVYLVGCFATEVTQNRVVVSRII